MLNVYVHHEMLAPLKSNVIISRRLIEDSSLNALRAKGMLQTLLVSSQLQLYHCNDLLDYHIIENGGFEPHYSTNSIKQAVLDIIDLARSIQVQKSISINCNFYEFEEG